ncbi:hypothetical protein BDQ12DRAFT_666027 [Crucibulum laeve]|uniref:Uncharacterized protein n=1 Tax=Crucibulum laeve TaxID=68775 RepID=A0A5C3M096_9AGAR|nr:hypothetical protein BDQ12DRAFT_666027 [Crucibulum laeve]
MNAKETAQPRERSSEMRVGASSVIKQGNEHELKTHVEFNNHTYWTRSSKGRLNANHAPSLALQTAKQERWRMFWELDVDVDVDSGVIERLFNMFVRPIDRMIRFNIRRLFQNPRITPSHSFIHSKHHTFAPSCSSPLTQIGTANGSSGRTSSPADSFVLTAANLLDGLDVRAGWKFGHYVVGIVERMVSSMVDVAKLRGNRVDGECERSGASQRVVQRLEG